MPQVEDQNLPNEDPKSTIIEEDTNCIGPECLIDEISTVPPTNGSPVAPNAEVCGDQICGESEGQEGTCDEDCI